MVELLVFDFDGLILDTELPEFQCWQEIYAEHGCHLPLSTWAPCLGTVGAFDPFAHLEGQLGRPLDRLAVRARRETRFAELLAAEAVRPGVKAYTAAARRRGLKLGLASSSSRDWVAGHLARLDLLAVFDALRCAGDVPRVKPELDLYLSVCEALAVEPARAVAFEDSPNGILAAKRAGLFCVAVPNALTRQLALDGADLTVASLADVPLEAILHRAAGGGR